MPKPRPIDSTDSLLQPAQRAHTLSEFVLGALIVFVIAAIYLGSIFLACIHR